MQSEDEVCAQVAELIARTRKWLAGFKAAWNLAREHGAPQHPRVTLAVRRCNRVMNLKIKFRESFRPFARIVLREHVDRYFDVRPAEDNLICCRLRP